MCEGSFLPAVLVLTKSILSSNRAFALIQSILSPFLRKGGQSCGPYHDRHCLVADDSSLTSPTHRKPRWVGQPGNLRLLEQTSGKQMADQPNSETPQAVINALLASGFPFQTAVAQVVRQCRGYRLVGEEVAWRDDTGTDQFLDLVAQRGHVVLPIEC